MRVYLTRFRIRHIRINEILRKLETTEFHEDMTVTTNEVAKVMKGIETGQISWSRQCSC